MTEVTTINKHSAGAAYESAATSWQAPSQLPNRDTVEYPTFDITVVPEPLRGYVVDEAQRKGVTPEQVYTAMLPSLGSTIGNTTRVFPHANDETWAEAPNLYALLVGQPSSKKSPSVEAGLYPLKTIQRRLETEYAKATSERRATEQAIDTQIKAHSKKLEKASAASNAKEVEACTVKLVELETAKEATRKNRPFRIVGDATSEALLEVVAENPRGVLVHRDEYSGLLDSMSRAGHENDRSFYNEGFNSGRYSAHRITRPGSTVDPLTISMLGTIQPEPFRRFTRSFLDNGGGDGFLARHQLVLWINPEALGKPKDRKPDIEARELAVAVFEAIEENSADILDRKGNGSFEGVHFDNAAQTIMDGWRDELRTLETAHATQSRPAYQAHLGKTYAATVRIALINHMIERVTGNASEQISESQAESAISLMKYYLQHAAITYELATDSRLPLAYTLLDKIDRGDISDGMTVRDVQRIAGRYKSTEVREALQLLEEHGHVQVIEVPNPGAKASILVRLHPDYRYTEPSILN